MATTISTLISLDAAIGKKIVRIEERGYDDFYDRAELLVIVFTDGSCLEICPSAGAYGGVDTADIVHLRSVDAVQGKPSGKRVRITGEPAEPV